MRVKFLPPRKTIIKLAGLTDLDPRTVAAYLAGSKKTIPPVAEAIRTAMRGLGLEVQR